MLPLSLLLLPSAAAAAPCEGQLLPNGICLGWTTPPGRRQLDPLTASEPPPYLRQPPAAINITQGRQLFVDSFLVDEAQSRPAA